MNGAPGDEERTPADGSNARATLRKRLLVLAPLVTLVTAVAGLHIGAPAQVRAAVVYGAPPAKGRPGLAWQVAVFEEDGVLREPVAGAPLVVTATSERGETTWSGTTNEDGVAEVRLDLPISAGEPLHIVVREPDRTRALAEGAARWDAEGSLSRSPIVRWAQPAARDGEVQLDVAVMGERLVPGFGSTVWARATDRARGRPLDGISVAVDEDPALVAAKSPVVTDPRGWTALTVRPVGHVVQLSLRAEGSNGASGRWVGGLPVAPGGAYVALPARIAPGTPRAVEVQVPTVRSSAYVEVDDGAGRAAAASLSLRADAQGEHEGAFEIPALAPGLYWLVTAGDAAGARTLAPGTVARPFFVATTDDAAFAFGPPSPEACAPPADPRLAARALGPCLAVTAAPPFARWTALDGFTLARTRDARNRRYGLGLALGSVLVAAVLEALLLLEAAQDLRRRRRSLGQDGIAMTAPRHARLTFVVGLLVALLGFGLFGALLIRFG